MAHNRTTRVKRGETGHIISVTFYQDDGETVYDLTGHTAVIEVTAQDDATNLLEGTNMTIASPASGVATYTMSANDALIAAGTYDWECRATHTSSGRVRIAPKVDGYDYGIFIMKESKIGA